MTIALAGGLGETHRIVPTLQAGVAKDESERFTPSGSTVDPEATGSSCRTRSAPWTTTSSSTAPVAAEVIGGLVDGRTYYYKDAGGGWFQLRTKKSDDPSGVIVDLTSLPTDGGPVAQLHVSGKTRLGRRQLLRSPPLTLPTASSAAWR